MLNDPMTFDDNELHSSLYSARIEASNYGSGGNSTDTPQDSPKYPTLSEKVNAILSEFPGFSGLALTLDKAEQFLGPEWFPPNMVIHLPRSGNKTIDSAEGIVEETATLIFAPQDYIGAAIYSTIRTIGDNLTPLALRAMVTFIGLLLVLSLIWKAVDGVSTSLTGTSAADLVNKVSFAAG